MGDPDRAGQINHHKLLGSRLVYADVKCIVLLFIHQNIRTGRCAQALAQPLDPQSLAQGISSEQEALEVYYISCAVIDIDHFMERSYLNALGEALKLPQEVREDIERDIQAQKQAVTL